MFSVVNLRFLDSVLHLQLQVNKSSFCMYPGVRSGKQSSECLFFLNASSTWHRTHQSSWLCFLITFFFFFFFCPWKIEHQRTTHKEQMTKKFHLLFFKNRQKNKERRHPRVAATGREKWQSKGGQSSTYTFSLNIFSCLVKEAFPQRIQQPTEEQGKNRVHKRGIKLPLYKNRSFPSVFLSFLFEHFTVLCNKESSDCVTSSAFPDYIFF